MEQQIKFISLGNLKLDKLNPRLPTSLHHADENKIINWMLADASIIELMLAIGENDFFIGDALLVIEKDNDYIVVEGNRRLSALKLLNNPQLANIHQKKIQRVLEITKYRPKNIPCIVFNKREEILNYLGYRHVTGIKSWGILAKARYLYNLIKDKDYNLTEVSRELAKQIGSRSDYVRRMIISYEIFEVIKDNLFYKIANLNEDNFYFNYIVDSLRYENIRKFLRIELNNDDWKAILNYKNLEVLIKLFFEKNSENKSRVLGNSDNLKKLDKILSNKEVMEKFLNGLSLNDAFLLIEVDASSFTFELDTSLKHLKLAHSYIHKIIQHNENDIDILKEIVSLCKILKNDIESKGDEWSL